MAGWDPDIDSGTDMVSVAKSDDTNDPSGPFRGFYILGSTGTIKITTHIDEDREIPSGLATGIFHPIRVKRFWDNGTTATDIVGVV